MGLYVRQDQNRTELQDRIAAELQEKARKRTEMADRPDGVDDSQYMEGKKQTTSLALVWLVIAVIAIALIIWLVIQSAQSGV
jgi:type VI protein secretion system component VasF